MDGFSNAMMEQIVGSHSLMLMLNNTFTFNVGHEMGYTGNQVDLKDFINDQWSSRAITKNTAINLTAFGDEGMLNSVFDLYSNLVSSVPESFTLTKYPPELNYFLAETLKLLDDDIVFG
jgi:hypothetical protein